MSNSGITYLESPSFAFAKRTLFFVFFLFSILGYIPGAPYWLYNIGTFLGLPVVLCIILIYRFRLVTKYEVIFMAAFTGSLLLSYVFSPYGFTIAGFLRAIVPVSFYYTVRVLRIEKDDYYFQAIFVFLILSFLLSTFQFLFQPTHVMDDAGNWETVEVPTFLIKRPVSFLGNANVFGVFTVFCFLILMTEKANQMSKGRRVLIFVLTLLNVFLMAKSRTSLLAFIMSVVIFLAYKRKFIPLLVMGATLVLVGLFVAANYDKIEALDNLFRLSSLSSEGDNSYSLRSQIAKFGWQLFLERPLLGVGVGNEHQLLVDTQAPWRAMESATLLLLVERGLLGYFIYLYILTTKFLFVRGNITRVLIGFVMISVDFTETVCVISQLATFLAVYLGVSANSLQSPDKRSSY